MQNRDFLTHNKISLGVSDRLPWVKIGSFATVRELARIPLHSALSQRERPKWNSSKGRLFNEKLDALVIVNRNFYIYYPNDIDPSPLTFSQTKKYLVLSLIFSNSYVQNKSCKYFFFFLFQILSIFLLLNSHWENATNKKDRKIRIPCTSSPWHKFHSVCTGILLLRESTFEKLFRLNFLLFQIV